METLLSSSSPTFPNSKNRSPKSTAKPIGNLRFNQLISNQRLTTRVATVDNVLPAATDPVQAEVTWQILVGTVAGVTPFVVAGIEFSKRIIAQKRCEVCKGSGLVLEDHDYFRCPECGGFLPWQSWKRFFSG